MINVAYNEILVYTTDGKKLFPNSNIIKYNVHPWHTVDLNTIQSIKKKYNIEYPYTLQPNDSKELISELNRFKSQDFIELLDNNKNHFRMCTLDEVYDSGENFIYPIILYNNDLFLKYTTIDLPEKLIKSVLNKKAKICFYQPTEGFYAQNNNDIVWMYNLSKKYGFDKNNIIVIVSNMMANNYKNQLISNGLIIDNFTIFPYNYFQHNLWFSTCKILNDGCVENMREKFNECLISNKESKKLNHFLCFNRVTKLHRVAIFGELMSNDALKDKSISTLGGSQNGNEKHFFTMILQGLADSYEHSKVRLLKYYRDYDSTKHHIYDCDDLENNKANNLNTTAHKNTFVNIITESLIDNRSVFYSEKTFKPMACAQPFILFGNPYSLKKLKEYGFKTFDKWWDESYDDETDFAIRLAKIVNVLKEIASWDMEKCYSITQEMEEVLVNNFNVMTSDKEVMKLIDLLKSKPIRLI